MKIVFLTAGYENLAVEKQFSSNPFIDAFII
jgi:hypothetical protein